MAWLPTLALSRAACASTNCARHRASWRRWHAAQVPTWCVCPYPQPLVRVAMPAPLALPTRVTCAEVMSGSPLCGAAGEDDPPAEQPPVVEFRHRVVDGVEWIRTRMQADVALRGQRTHFVT